jgi:hypothetical protein
MAGHKNSVQFIGGPLDGYSCLTPNHLEPVILYESGASKPKQRVLTRFLCWFSWVRIKEANQKVFATYRLELHCGESVYMYLGSKPAVGILALEHERSVGIGTTTR